MAAIAKPAADEVPCPKCALDCTACDGDGSLLSASLGERPCGYCQGSGAVRLGGESCDLCGARGQIPKSAAAGHLLTEDDSPDAGALTRADVRDAVAVLKAREAATAHRRHVVYVHPTQEAAIRGLAPHTILIDDMANMDGENRSPSRARVKKNTEAP